MLKKFRKNTRRNKKIKEGNKIIVSEHAMLRYIERVLGIDLKEIERRILTDEVKEQYKIVGNGRFPINDEFRALIRDNVVVTITGVEKNKTIKIMKLYIFSICNGESV